MHKQSPAWTKREEANLRHFPTLTEHVQSDGSLDCRHLHRIARLTSQCAVVCITLNVRYFQSINDHVTTHRDTAIRMKLLGPIVPRHARLRPSCKIETNIV